MIISNELIITFLSVGILTFLIYKIVDLYIKRRKYSHIPGPPADGILGFFFGNLKEIIKSTKNDGMFTDLLNEWYLNIQCINFLL